MPAPPELKHLFISAICLLAIMLAGLFFLNHKGWRKHPLGIIVMGLGILACVGVAIYILAISWNIDLPHS
jgi:hypothetical protein